MRLEKVLLLAAAALGLVLTISKLETTHRKARRRGGRRQKLQSGRGQRPSSRRNSPRKDVVDNNHPQSVNDTVQDNNCPPELSILRAKADSSEGKPVTIYQTHAFDKEKYDVRHTISQAEPLQRLDMVDVQRLSRNLFMLESELNTLKIKSRPR